MGKLHKELKKGLEEIIAYKEGRITLKSEIIQIPEPPKRQPQTPKICNVKKNT